MNSLIHLIVKDLAIYREDFQYYGTGAKIGDGRVLPHRKASVRCLVLGGCRVASPDSSHTFGCD
jgi:hypothetical protein